MCACSIIRWCVGSDYQPGYREVSPGNNTVVQILQHQHLYLQLGYKIFFHNSTNLCFICLKMFDLCTDLPGPFDLPFHMSYWVPRAVTRPVQIIYYSLRIYVYLQLQVKTHSYLKMKRFPQIFSCHRSIYPRVPSMVVKYFTSNIL